MIENLIRTTAFFLAALVAFAGTVRPAAATDRYTTGKVAETMLGTNGWVSFTLEGSPALCATASGGGTTWVVLSTQYISSDLIKSYLSMLSAAKLSGRQITVRALNSNVSNEWGCRIDGLSLQ